MQPNFPPGIRFVPTDEELINHYLLKKVLGKQLPSDAVIEGEVYGDNAQLPEGNGSVEEQYLFVKRKKNQKGTKTTRLAGNGYWKDTGNKKKIFDKSRNIGTKRSLVFKRKSNSRRKKNLLMDEYSLTVTGPMIQNNPEGWVLCKIKQSNRSPERDGISPLIEDSHIHEQCPIEFGGGPSHPCQDLLFNPSSPVEFGEGPSHFRQDPPFNPSSEMEIISTSRPTALPGLQVIDNKINSLVIDDTECFDIDALLASPEDNPATAQCPFETAGGPSHMRSDQSFDQSLAMMATPTLTPTQPPTLGGIDYNWENNDDWTNNENFFNAYMQLEFGQIVHPNFGQHSFMDQLHTDLHPEFGSCSYVDQFPVEFSTDFT